MQFFIDIINFLIKGIGSIFSFAIGVLPNSPFQVVENTEFISNIGWIIPIAPILSILQLWVSAIAIYYIVQVALRWVKAIE